MQLGQCCSCTPSTTAPVLAAQPAHTLKLQLLEKKNKAASDSREQHNPPHRGNTTRSATRISLYAKQQELPQPLKLPHRPADFRMPSARGSHAARCLLQAVGPRRAEPGAGTLQGPSSPVSTEGKEGAHQAPPAEPKPSRTVFQLRLSPEDIKEHKALLRSSYK